MKYTFSLEETDYLTHQLFVASTSKTAIASRRRSWALTTLAFLLMAWLFYQSTNEFLANYFLVAGIISALLYPLYSKWRYKNHYKKHVNANHAKSFGQTANVEFLSEHILAKDDSNSESKISLSQIESLNELPEHFLVRLAGGQSLILPKHKIERLNELRADLMELGKNAGIELTDRTDWKWK